MSDGVMIGLFALCGVLITVLGGIATLFINRWFKKMDEKLDRYHKEVNGKMSKLLEVTAAVSKAEGKEEQKQDDIDNNKT